MATIVVTGGSGFIGSNLVERLETRGHSIVIIDRRVPAQRLLGLAKFVKGDIRTKSLVSRSIRGADVIVHLAGLTDARAPSTSFSEYHSVNVTATINLLQQAAKQGVRRFLLASSAAVYGKADCYPISEETPIRPISFYGATKAAAEIYTSAMAHRSRVSCSVFRIFNVYGSRYKTVGKDAISVILKTLGSGGRPRIYGDGRQTRDFIHVDDVAGAIATFIDKEAAEGIFNIGTGVETPVNDVVRLAKLACGRPSARIVHLRKKDEDIVRSVADVSRLSRLLGFRPALSIREGIFREAGELGLR